MSFRRWVFTLNNYNESDESLLSNLDCSYLIYGREVGPSGTPHLQGFVVFARTKRLSAVVSLLNRRAHWEPARGTNEEASEYCRKDGNFVEFGSIPCRGRSGLLTQVAEDVLHGVPPVSIAKSHPSIFVRHYRGLRELANIVHKPYDHDDVRGIWIYGKPGTGKSRYVRDTYGDDMYLKSQNKWFDNYQDEKTILLDDMDRQGECLGHHLKIWTDRYACTGETKGGTVALRHHRFIVTSNYTIAELFGTDVEIYRAILRRFTVLNFNITPYWPSSTTVTTDEANTASVDREDSVANNIDHQDMVSSLLDDSIHLPLDFTPLDPFETPFTDLPIYAPEELFPDVPGCS